ncbi:MAG: hypothetical protein IPO91_31905 [Chloroflexi bacterium]|nr:hypothetical protein [Chloroflexota bacterium]
MFKQRILRVISILGLLFQLGNAWLVQAQTVLNSHRPTTASLSPGDTHTYQYILRNEGDLVIIVHVHEVEDYGTVWLRLKDSTPPYNVIAETTINNNKSFGYYDGQIEVELEEPKPYNIEVSLAGGDRVEYMIWALGRRENNPCLARLRTESGDLYYQDYGQNTIFYHPGGDDLSDGFHLINTQDVWAEHGDNYGQVYMTTNDSADYGNADTRIEIEPMGWIRLLEAQLYIQLMNGSALIDENTHTCRTVLIAGSLRAEYHSRIIASVNERTGITAITLRDGTLTIFDQGATVNVPPGQVYYKNERTNTSSIRPLSDFGLSSFQQVRALARQGRDIEGNSFPGRNSVTMTDPDIRLYDTGAWGYRPPPLPPPTPVPNALNYTLPPVFGFTNLISGFVPDPYTVPVTGGGLVNVSYLQNNCVGFASEAPSFSVYYTSGSSGYLRFYFVGAGDTTMIVNSASGEWRCNDDSSGTLNPTVDFGNPDGDGPQSGRYDIWIGTFNTGNNISGTLYVTERLSNHP